MLAILFVLFQTVATTEIQKQIDALTVERAQLLQVQKDCGPANKANVIATLQAIIDKLTALKADPQASADIDAIFDELIGRLQTAKDAVNGAIPGRDCALEPGAAARIGLINAQLAKLEILKTK